MNWLKNLNNRYMQYTPWHPSFRFHARLLGVLVLVCALLFVVIFYQVARLPAPYQTYSPAPQTTPWKIHLSEDL